MSCLREIEPELVDIVVKSDNKPALTSLTESWNALRAIKQSASRMIIENNQIGSSKSNGIFENAIQSLQGTIRLIRSSIEENWNLKLHVTHSMWLCIAERAGFLLTSFEVGRDGKTACERLEGKSVSGVT